MSSRIQWLVVLVALIALAAWIFPEFGHLIGVAAIVVVGIIFVWGWLTG
jgi:hypothetical protein